MPGDGTRPAITRSEPPPARLLDLTRLARRAGRTLTGIDRVEYAYARHMSRQDIPCYGLVRSAFGVLLIRPELLWPVVQRICAGHLRAPDLLSRLARRRSRAEQQAETEFRAAALARGRPRRLETLLRRHLPPGFSYINVGHSHLTTQVFDAVRRGGGRSAVMVHDVVPLEHPEFQREGTVAGFARKMQAVRAGADVLLYNSQGTQRSAELCLGQWGPVPPGAAVLLGVEAPPAPRRAAAALELPDAPYFVALGTIEPRKNIGFLLDLWEEMGADAPGLVLCGARGWKSADVFARLDALPQDGPVREMGMLGDAERDALLAGANGLLMPSHAEGFGLPTLEAAQIGLPVICNTLDVYRETLGDIPIYASVKEPYLWIKQIRSLAAREPGAHRPGSEINLTWQAHFKTVLKMI